jgi:hypothetical protein
MCMQCLRNQHITTTVIQGNMLSLFYKEIMIHNVHMCASVCITYESVDRLEATPPLYI